MFSFSHLFLYHWRHNSAVLGRLKMHNSKAWNPRGLYVSDSYYVKTERDTLKYFS